MESLGLTSPVTGPDDIHHQWLILILATLTWVFGSYQSLSLCCWKDKVSVTGEYETSLIVCYWKEYETSLLVFVTGA